MHGCMSANFRTTPLPIPKIPARAAAAGSGFSCQPRQVGELAQGLVEDQELQQLFSETC